MVDMDTEKKEVLKVLIIGLSEAEQKMLGAVVRLSVRRNPSLALLEEHEQETADVIVLDAASDYAQAWGRDNRKLLETKPVIWVDAKKVKSKHIKLQRPVMWSNLPIVISQAIETYESYQLDTSEVFAQQHDVIKTEKSVLAVDDSKAVCDYVASALASAGIKVVTANSGEEALEILKTRKDFFCVLMDVLMPGMDGYDACRLIKNQEKHIPVVMLTGKTSPFDRIRAKMAGSDAYITKPINQEDLIARLQTYIH